MIVMRSRSLQLIVNVSILCRQRLPPPPAQGDIFIESERGHFHGVATRVENALAFVQERAKVRSNSKQKSNSMQSVTTIELTRDCEAVQIPVGAAITLPKGTAVDITQTLGGTYTVHVQGGLYRISAKDADALGLEVAAAQEKKEAERANPGGQGLDERMIWETLRTCYDPEIPVNIVDLGLVYDLQIEQMPAGSHRVNVKMTLTAPGCGRGATIAGDAQQKLLALDGVDEADVELVWDPAWHPSMISEQGKRILGLE